MATEGKTFEEVAKDAVGTVYLDTFGEGLRLVILRGPASICAYLGVPESHPLAGFDEEDLPANAHGGLTYSGKGGGKGGSLPAGFWFYGWDYAHCGDFCFYDNGRDFKSDDAKWTPELVEKDAWITVYDMKRLMKLAERIASREAKHGKV